MLVALEEEPSVQSVPHGSSASAAYLPCARAALACELCGDTTGPFQNPLNRVYCVDFDACDVRRGVRAIFSHQALGRCKCGECHTITEAIALNGGPS